jgi:hypothetical protein
LKDNHSDEDVKVGFTLARYAFKSARNALESVANARDTILNEKAQTWKEKARDSILTVTLALGIDGMIHSGCHQPELTSQQIAELLHQESMAFRVATHFNPTLKSHLVNQLTAFIHHTCNGNSFNIQQFANLVF